MMCGFCPRKLFHATSEDRDFPASVSECVVAFAPVEENRNTDKRRNFLMLMPLAQLIFPVIPNGFVVEVRALLLDAIHDVTQRGAGIHGIVDDNVIAAGHQTFNLVVRAGMRLFAWFPADQQPFLHSQRKNGSDKRPTHAAKRNGVELDTAGVDELPQSAQRSRQRARAENLPQI